MLVKHVKFVDLCLRVTKMARAEALLSNNHILITANKCIHIISAYFLAAASNKCVHLLTSLYGSRVLT